MEISVPGGCAMHGTPPCGVSVGTVVRVHHLLIWPPAAERACSIAP